MAVDKTNCIANTQCIVPFRGETDSVASNPITKNDKKGQEDFVSKDYASATRAMAMAQIMIGSEIKPGLTQADYVAQLIKKGKVQDKDFYIKTHLDKPTTYIEEVNKNGERIKEVNFSDDGSITCGFYEPKTQKRYKTVDACDDKLYVSYNNPSGDPVLDEVYRPDGSLERNAYYKKTPKGETSPNGDYIITGMETQSVT